MVVPFNFFKFVLILAYESDHFAEIDSYSFVDALSPPSLWCLLPLLCVVLRMLWSEMIQLLLLFLLTALVFHIDK